MGIVTKTGDKGTTSLYCSARVDKDDIRIETCGTLDEVSSFLGMAKSLVKEREFKDIIEVVQKDLLLIGTEVATRREFVNKLKKRICDKEVRCLEEKIEALECGGRLRFAGFSMPGENAVSSAFDIARAVARKAERRSAALLKQKMLSNRNVLIYLNRLSDLLFLLARSQEKNKKCQKK
jgi:cob(I)alamin adenosyltransferase